MPGSSPSNKSNAQILEELTGATCALVIDEPFYGHFFSGLLKEVHEGIQTMSIGPSGNAVKLHINPRFWTEDLQTTALRRGLIKHEILHLVFKHIFRGKGAKHKRIYNIACDLVVNQYVRADRLPESRIHMGLFPDLELEPEREAEYYYDKLAKLYEQKTSEQEKQGGDEGQEGDRAQSSGGGSPGEGKPSNSQGKQDSWENLKQLLDEDNEWQQKHEQWKEIEELPKAVQEVLQDAVDGAIRNSVERANVKGWGDLPGQLRSYLQQFSFTKQPEINWRRALRLFTESSARTFLRNTVRRPSKRYGTTPGIKIRRRQRLLLALDTSGSISDGDLKAFFNEIFHIWKRGAEILVVECDHEIGAVYPFRGRLPEHITGRGGTRFDPPLQYANERWMPDALIYFTDGYAPEPKVKARYPLLWVVSSSGITESMGAYQQLPGKKVKMKQAGSS